MNYRIRYAAVWLAGIVLGVYFLQQIFSPEPFLLERSLKFSEPWRLITSIFAHGGPVHLINNLIALVLFGLMLEGRIGPKRVLWLFLITGVIVNVLSPYERSLGASGAVYGILGALAALRPGMTIYVSYLPMPMILAGLLWLVQDIFGIFYPSGVASIAHISGLFMGVAVGIYWRKKFGDPLFGAEKQRKDPGIEKKLDEWEQLYMRRK